MVGRSGGLHGAEQRLLHVRYCRSSPCNLGPSKDGAPAPCDYYSAATGFHKILAPLLLAVLFMLAVILAVWLGHDTVLKIFKSLVTGQTK